MKEQKRLSYIFFLVSICTYLGFSALSILYTAFVGTTMLPVFPGSSGVLGAALIFSIAFMLIPLAWFIPMLLAAKKSIDDGKAHIGLGVCMIIFGGGVFGIVAGIMMLVASSSNTQRTGDPIKTHTDAPEIVKEKSEIS